MSKKNQAYFATEPITYMTYDDYEDIHDKMIDRRRKRAAKDRERRAIYYRQQRKLGLSVIGIGVICLLVACILRVQMLQYFGGVVGFIGLYIMLTPQMILVNQYYLERRDRLNEY